jgi:pantoate--beta-alanine ligase
MQIVHTIKEAREIIAEARKKGSTVGLVPTMGFLHEGHLTLMRTADSENDFVVASIFVNPIQFGPKEDLQAYPRDLARDAALAESAGVDLIFNPTVEEMYPAGYNTYVEVQKITDFLCGATRKGHFGGVATVVTKLFNIVRPDKAYFGCKDYQQLKVIERMVRDLNMPIEIVPVPIVRESDGVAMSSRNTYLSAEERQSALVLSKALGHAQKLLDEGVTSGPEIVRRATEFIEKNPHAQIDYVSVVDAETLEFIDEIEDVALLALAVRIGKTRLIDNALLKRN